MFIMQNRLDRIPVTRRPMQLLQLMKLAIASQHSL